MGFSEIAMNESFYYSNMSPQVASFNRGVWKKLENKVRKLLELIELLFQMLIIKFYFKIEEGNGKE